MAKPIHLKDHNHDARIVQRRLILAAVFILGLVGALVARMYYLQVTQYEYHSTLSENNRVHVQPIPPTRGRIYDRNGVVLAENRPSFSLTITRDRVEDLPATFELLKSLLELSEEDAAQAERRLSQARRPFESVPVMFELTQEQIARIAINQFRLPGVDVQASFVRYYPFADHFAHALGYVGRINEQELKSIDPVAYAGTHYIGKTGIERYYEQLLHGTVGYEEVETNARGRVLRVLNRTDPIPGRDLTLELDVKLQQVAEEALGDRRGAVVAIDPATGGVLAFVSKPGFDPNLFVTGISYADYGALRDSLDQPLFNRVLRGQYPPGSTIKPIVALAGLDAGVVTRTSRVYDPGFYQLPNVSHKYRNWNRSGDGWVDMSYAIARSNDTYFYDLANKLGIDRMHDFMSQFGIGQRVSIDMYEEAAGLMPSSSWKRTKYRQPWYPGETLIAGIGQGYMLATPLQLAQSTALIASRGVWHRPRLLKNAEGVLPDESETPPNIQLRNPADWDFITQAMQDVMQSPHGTARAAAAGATYNMAGKSGTAQVVAIAQGERYDSAALRERHRDHALFVGFAPTENPMIAVAALVENGEGGGRVAGPVVRAVFDAWVVPRLEAEQQQGHAESQENGQ
ncbi:penicillin-binding protein 2 [Halopseudomonas aestusnigri]|jgi:penicillin-binding protein 2|uniref:penicillin-binding protein 2 n=1 Tax=Halopseudomonas TaxID=2901189 RepID=UPI000C5D5D2A|nr:MULTISPECIES: penicillin-binding protein 2 [Halopseudomonas]MAD27483.1 penicillin-binding protein 2 [Pseudomonadales bacterium]MCC4259554.1 penicillin-binding protein 2 [Halopseudomonas aestusnigri]MDL2197871.1 penicillin-binding protein 2 [Halopseudomonas aestusnigri]UGV29613.1 penicillin-binding protein 2 [Halopseudomonas aestusnigri]BDX19169.1 penicillin-binding protein 2 [Halopseudomonas aestusnigri]|tara:strand:- start:376 stop:2259 length:1884 start_codon:yes stop_codon:yes gene_type:complete